MKIIYKIIDGKLHHVNIPRCSLIKKASRFTRWLPFQKGGYPSLFITQRHHRKVMSSKENCVIFTLITRT